MSRPFPVHFLLAAGVCSTAALLYFQSTPQAPLASNETAPRSPSNEATSHASEPSRNRLVQLSERTVPTADPEPSPLAESNAAVARRSETFNLPNRPVDSNPKVINHSVPTAVIGRPFSQSPQPRGQLDDVVEIDIPPGAQLPVALLQASNGTDSGTELNPAQQGLAEKVAEDFVREIATTGAAGEGGSANPGEYTAEVLNRWRQVKDGADERLRSLLGQDIYNREIIRQHQVNQQTLPKH
jgi:hypothetical protein